MSLRDGHDVALDLQATRGAPPTAWRDALDATDRFLGRLVEIPAALLVVIEVGLLLAGVVARFALHKPLIWSDELASILFQWLAMFGAVIALRRNEHMRMTAIVSRSREPWRAWLESIAIASTLAFLLLVAVPAWEYARDEAIITTPALELSNVWRASALPVGVALMALFCLLHLARAASLSYVAAGVVTVVAVSLALWFAAPLLAPLGRWNLLVFFVGLGAGCVFAGIPIAFSFGLATFAYLALVTSTPLTVLVGRVEAGMSQMALLAVPLFVFLGLLIAMTGMARAMVAFLVSLVGHVKGGLSYVLIGAMYLVSGISGSKAADMAAVAPALFPEMKERGAKPGELVALLSATGAQTETIPPSLVLITIGSATGVSIAALFTGGLLPGLVVGIILCLMAGWRARRSGEATVPRASKRDVARLFAVALPALALPFVIRAAVTEGVATATEVATIGIVYAVFTGAVFYRQFDVKRLYPMLVDTACLSGAILLIIGAATGMAWGVTQSGFSQRLAELMAAVPGGSAMFLAVSIVAFVLLGSVLEGIPAMVLFGPLLFPVAQQLGIHPVHYAMVVILSMGIGLFAPPLGVGYYAACAIGRVDPDHGIRPILGYLLALLAGTVVVAAVPWISIGFL